MTGLARLPLSRFASLRRESKALNLRLAVTQSKNIANNAGQSMFVVLVSAAVALAAVARNMTRVPCWRS